MKRCSSLLIISEMQIKATMKYHPYTSQNGHHQKATNNKCWRGCGEKESLLHCWWELKTDAATMENSTEVSQKI